MIEKRNSKEHQNIVTWLPKFLYRSIIFFGSFKANGHSSKAHLCLVKSIRYAKKWRAFTTYRMDYYDRTFKRKNTNIVKYTVRDQRIRISLTSSIFNLTYRCSSSCSDSVAITVTYYFEEGTSKAQINYVSHHTNNRCVYI